MSRALTSFAAGLCGVFCLTAGAAFAQASTGGSFAGNGLMASEHGAAPGTGEPEVNVQIAFPRGQSGLDNIMAVMLEPERPGAHECLAIAQVDTARGVIVGWFQARTDVRRGFSYTVVIGDARGGRYPVGHIRVATGTEQTFSVTAPQLTSASPQYASADSPDLAASEPSGAMPAWMMGIEVKTLTPELAKANGHSQVATQGAIVVNVVSGSQAERLGVVPGDVVLRVNGLRIATADQLLSYSSDRRAGKATNLYLFSRKFGRFVSLRIPVDVSAASRNIALGPNDAPPSDAGSAHIKRPATGPVYLPASGP